MGHVVEGEHPIAPAATAAIRTGLNYFLQHELDRAADLDGKRRAMDAHQLRVRQQEAGFRAPGPGR